MELPIEKKRTECPEVEVDHDAVNTNLVQSGSRSGETIDTLTEVTAGTCSVIRSE
jgi:hypothetical protein